MDSLLPDGRGSKRAVHVDLLLNWAVGDNSLGGCFVLRGLHGHHANTVEREEEEKGERRGWEKGELTSGWVAVVERKRKGDD